MLTTAQAAAELGVSERRVQQLVKSGVIAAQRFAGVWVIHPRAIEKARKRPDRRGRPKKAKAGTVAGT